MSEVTFHFVTLNMFSMFTLTPNKETVREILRGFSVFGFYKNNTRPIDDDFLDVRLITSMSFSSCRPSFCRSQPKARHPNVCTSTLTLRCCITLNTAWTEKEVCQTYAQTHAPNLYIQKSFLAPVHVFTVMHMD